MCRRRMERRGRRSIDSKITEYETEQGLILKNSTVARFIRLWNSLPAAARGEPIKTFKKAAKAFLEEESGEDDE